MKQFLEKARKFEVTAYVKPKDLTELRKTHVPYSGSPKLHPNDPNIVILLVDPYGGNTVYYEFKRDSISHVEELPSLANIDGDVVPMVRIWVKKSSVGMLCTPFLVTDSGL